jgi:outer membrane receptor protein involved in Fe transport
MRRKISGGNTVPKSILLNQACHGAIALLLAGTVASPALAEADPQTASPSQIVVHGQVLPEQTAPESPPLTAAFSESTITSEALRNLPNDVSLQTMLASQPSIFAFETGPNGVGANIFFRAFNSGQFAETIDGVAINDIFNGGVTGQAATWNSVLFIPQDIDSVVLNNGISNPVSNSYNSLGGTIDFLPKLPTEKFGINVAGTYGSFNSWGLAGSVNTGNLGGFKQLIQIDYRKSDGWVANTGNDNLNIYYSGKHDDANGGSLSLVAVYNRNAGAKPYDMPVPILQAEGGFGIYDPSIDYQHARDNEWTVILDHKMVISPVVTFDNKFFGGGQDFVRTSFGNPTYSGAYPLPDKPAGYDYWIYFPNGPTYNPKTVFGSKAAGNDYHFYGYTNWAIGYSPKLTFTLPQNTVTIGGNWTYGELHSRQYWYGSAPVPQTLGYNDAWDEHDSRTLVSIYAQDEIKLLEDALTITPGLKYIYAKTKDTDAIGFYYPYGGSVGDSEHFVAPTIGVNYKVDEHLAFNAAFGENIKLPDIAAYYNDVPGTTGVQTTPSAVKIKPEHVNDYEVGVKYKDGGFSAALDYYREDFSNVFIDAFDPVSYTTSVSNGGSARYQGVEVQVADTFHVGDAGDIKAHVNFSYNDAKYTSSFVADSNGGSLSNSIATVTAGERMADVPRVLATGGLTWSYQGFRLDVSGRYIGQQLILDDSGTPAMPPEPTGIPGYAVFDLGLSKTLQLSDGHSVKVSFYARNLFNKYYYADSSVISGTQYASPAAPRSVSGKIELAF